MIFLSDVVADNPMVQDFWSLERCVSAAARNHPAGNTTAGQSVPGQNGSGQQKPSLRLDVVPEYRSTPRKWQIILTAAYERGLRARD